MLIFVKNYSFIARRREQMFFKAFITFCFRNFFVFFLQRYFYHFPRVYQSLVWYRKPFTLYSLILQSLFRIIYLLYVWRVLTQYTVHYIVSVVCVILAIKPDGGFQLFPPPPAFNTWRYNARPAIFDTYTKSSYVPWSLITEHREVSTLIQDRPTCRNVVVVSFVFN